MSIGQPHISLPRPFSSIPRLPPSNAEGYKECAAMMYIRDTYSRSRHVRPSLECTHVCNGKSQKKVSKKKWWPGGSNRRPRSRRQKITAGLGSIRLMIPQDQSVFRLILISRQWHRLSIPRPLLPRRPPLPLNSNTMGILLLPPSP